MAPSQLEDIRKQSMTYISSATNSSIHAANGVASYGALGHVPPLKLQKAIKIV
jgi:hypothetical protein